MRDIYVRNERSLIKKVNHDLHPSWLRVTFTSMLLIIVYQIFFYMKDFQVIYVFSKIISPVLIITATLFYIVAHINKVKLPLDGLLVLVSFLYLVSETLLTSYVYYGQPLYISLAWQIKLFPMLFFFPIYFLLTKGGVRIVDIYYATMILSVMSLIIYMYIYYSFNPENYIQDDSYFFVNDSKGYRFRFPATPVLLGLFVFFWRWIQNHKSIDALLFSAFLMYFVVIHQQRILLLCIFLLLGYRLWRRLSVSGRVVSIAVVMMVAVVMMTIIFSQNSDVSLLSGMQESGSYISRAKTVDDILSVLAGTVTGTLFGIGNLSPVYNGGFEALYGPYFWLSDVGWLGLLYEYGAIGVFIIGFLMFRLLWYAEKAVKFSDPVLLGMRDMAWIIALVSIISPRIVYSSGVTVTLLAVFVFVSRGYDRVYEDESIKKNHLI